MCVAWRSEPAAVFSAADLAGDRLVVVPRSGSSVSGSCSFTTVIARTFWTPQSQPKRVSKEIGGAIPPR
jgi:hypothetical protein